MRVHLWFGLFIQLQRWRLCLRGAQRIGFVVCVILHGGVLRTRAILEIAQDRGLKAIRRLNYWVRLLLKLGWVRRRRYDLVRAILLVIMVVLMVAIFMHDIMFQLSQAYGSYIVTLTFVDGCFDCFTNLLSQTSLQTEFSGTVFFFLFLLLFLLFA